MVYQKKNGEEKGARSSNGPRIIRPGSSKSGTTAKLSDRRVTALAAFVLGGQNPNWWFSHGVVLLSVVCVGCHTAASY